MAEFVTRRYVPAKDVSKTVRARLKAAYPDVRFSVRTEHHSAVNVRWTDGPTSAAVDALIGDLQAGHFDGMADMYEYKPAELLANPDGTLEQVSSGARYVFTYREISDEWQAGIFAQFSSLVGRTLDPSRMSGDWSARVPLWVGRDGKLLRMSRESDGDYVSNIFHRYTAVRARRADGLVFVVGPEA